MGHSEVLRCEADLSEHPDLGGICFRGDGFEPVTPALDGRLWRIRRGWHPDGMSPNPEVPERLQRRRYTAEYKAPARPQGRAQPENRTARERQRPPHQETRPRRDIIAAKISRLLGIEAPTDEDT
jgi:hypothetical protein